MEKRKTEEISPESEHAEENKMLKGEARVKIKTKTKDWKKNEKQRRKPRPRWRYDKRKTEEISPQSEQADKNKMLKGEKRVEMKNKNKDWRNWKLKTKTKSQMKTWKRKTEEDFPSYMSKPEKYIHLRVGQWSDREWKENVGWRK